MVNWDCGKHWRLTSLLLCGRALLVINSPHKVGCADGVKCNSVKILGVFWGGSSSLAVLYCIFITRTLQLYPSQDQKGK